MDRALSKNIIVTLMEIECQLCIAERLTHSIFCYIFYRIINRGALIDFFQKILMHISKFKASIVCMEKLMAWRSF